MQVKGFDEEWTGDEINEYIDQFHILVLFKTYGNIAQLLVYGKLDDDQKYKLKERITNIFGGQHLNKQICTKINEYASKWYTKIVLGHRRRIINVGKKGK